MRQLSRESNPNVSEIVRRYSADEHDFQDINFENIPLTNNTMEQFSAAVETIVAAGQNWIK